MKKNYPASRKGEAIDPEQATKYWLERVGIERPDIPDRFIITFDGGIYQIIKHNYYTKPIPELWRLSVGDPCILSEKEIGVVTVGWGAPVAAITMEKLIPLGAENFVIAGFAGYLQKYIEPGDIVVATRAIRDEGLSNHYIEPSEYSYPSRGITSGLKQSCKRKGCDFHSGATWTIPAPYRETADKVRKHRDNGVLTVEMEAASLFAVSKHRKKKTGAIFVTSDYVSPDGWEPHYLDKRIPESCNSAFEVAVETLS